VQVVTGGSAGGVDDFDAQRLGLEVLEDVREVRAGLLGLWRSTPFLCCVRDRRGSASSAAELDLKPAQ